MSVLLSGFSALCYGAGDYVGGRASRRSPVFSVLLLSQLTGLVGVLIAAPLVPDSVIRLRDLLWGAAAGASGVVGLALLYRALATSVAAIASPLAALIGAVAPAVAGAISGERPSTTAWIGIAVAIPAVILLSADRRTGDNPERAIVFGTLAGLGFGGFFVLIAQVSADSGLWALGGSKIASILLAILFHLVMRAPVRINRSSRLPAVAAGVLDMGANVLFLAAIRVGLLATSGVVSSLYPAPTVLLATIIDRQKLTGLRAAGLGFALAGVALMAA